MNILICDKSKKDAINYYKYIKEICESLNIEAKITFFNDIDKMLFSLEDIADQIDLIYLEYNHNNLSGKKVVQKIRKIGCRAEIIFLTYDDEHWPDGYDVEAFHYLLKNNEDNKFLDVFKNVINKIEKKDKKVMSFTFAGEKVIIEISNIEYFESQGRIITVHYNKNQTFDFYSRMSKLENVLLPEGFIRVHRSFLVNKTAIEDLKNNDIVLKNNELIPVSRNMKPIIKNLKSK